MMRRLKLCLYLLLGAATVASAATNLTTWERVDVAPMKTSLYVGSVRLTTTTFERQGSALTSTYVAKVFPWFPWNEHGKITINLTDANLASLARGETAEFTGEAFNHHDQRRTVTGRVQPSSPTSGKMKVRIMADGIELI